MKQALAGQKELAKIKPSGREVAALKSLLSDLNNSALTGADPPREDRTGLDATALPSSNLIPTRSVPPPPVTEPEPSPLSGQRDCSRFFFTGKLMVGKDWLASRLGAVVFGFADPLYALQEQFFPGTDKRTPGARAFLQHVGQWGRGLVDEQYPLTIARALFTAHIRSGGGVEDMQVHWAEFGLNKNLWLNALIHRVQAFRVENPEVLVAVTNCRFMNEFHRLGVEGWTHFHVIASPTTWQKRLASAGLVPNSLEVRDVSEELARALDADVTKRVSKGESGKKLRVVWCDSEVPCPSNRFYTIEEFLSLVPTTRPANETAPSPTVDLGEVTLED